MEKAFEVVEESDVLKGHDFSRANWAYIFAGFSR
jgi:hypothetical protein